MGRTRTWLAVVPLAAGGVLVAHALAYRLTGTPTGALHAYLDHAPQVLVLAALVGMLVGGLATRLRAPGLLPFALAAPATFVAQEHLERVAHTGELPWLLGSPAFLLGLLLQLPFAVASWWLARRLLEALEEVARGRAKVRWLPLDVAVPATRHVPAPAVPPRPGRGPPHLHRP